jgi:hypothetical protein
VPTAWGKWGKLFNLIFARPAGKNKISKNYSLGNLDGVFQIDLKVVDWKQAEMKITSHICVLMCVSRSF